MVTGKFALLLVLCCATAPVLGAGSDVIPGNLVQWDIRSHKHYEDPFNDVDVDVVFERDGKSWRVPAFWRGGDRWTIRFRAPAAGTYHYRLESTDRANTDLNGRDGSVQVSSYSGANPLLRRGDLRLSANRRYFEFGDGTPFYWLGDTWWSSLSSRLSWTDFKELTTDRARKGFTAVQLAAGLIPGEEQAPSDPGYCNEGGCVWTPGFERINPRYFDYADRRVEYLIGSQLVPVIVGAWAEKMQEMGLEKLKKHWRYVIARYGADPIVWVLGGEVFDPPVSIADHMRPSLAQFGLQRSELGQWTELARFVRATDPYHHLLTVHEESVDYLPLQDDSLIDFYLFQPSHAGWSSIAVEVGQLNSHYARTDVTKPLVVGEIGYEGLGQTHLEDFQRVAFWLAMLNGTAGFTYGADGLFETYTSDKPFQRLKWSLLTSKEAMKLPGSHQDGMNSRLLRQYQWWRFAPHPEWITPHGTTMLEARDGTEVFHVNLSSELAFPWVDKSTGPSDWAVRHGTFSQPYSAGIPGEVRFIYMPYFGLYPGHPPTVLGLEPGIRYHSFFWQPSLGVKIDLGHVESSLGQGEELYREDPTGKIGPRWIDYPSTGRGGEADAKQSVTIRALSDINEAHLTVSSDIAGAQSSALVLRLHKDGSYLYAAYDAGHRQLYIVDHKDGVNDTRLGQVVVGDLRDSATLTAEANGSWAIVSLADGAHIYTTEIVKVSNATAGVAGVMAFGGATSQKFSHFEIRRCPPLQIEEHLDRQLHDADGLYRGEIKGQKQELFSTSANPSSWDDFAKLRIILLDAYRPEQLPFAGDWVLVLEKTPSALH